MEINIAKSAGFCFGVRRAVETVCDRVLKHLVITECDLTPQVR